jgi:hypothetical protein
MLTTCPRSLAAQLRQHGLDDAPRAVEIDLEQMGDLFLGRLLHRTKQAVAGIVDHDVDALPDGDGALDRAGDRRPIGHVERQHMEPAGVVRDRRLAVARRADDGFAPGQQRLRQRHAEAARDPCDEPDLRSHVVILQTKRMADIWAVSIFE